jgi:hypothetical protein
VRRAWARSVRGNPWGAEGRGRARLRAGVRARNTEERDTKKKKLNVFEGYLSAGFCGRGFGVSSALTTRAGVPDSRYSSTVTA